MEYQKITNLLGNTSDKVPRFITKRWIEVHDQSGETYNTNKQITFKTSMLSSDLCDYSDAYIVAKGVVTVRSKNKIDRENRFLASKYKALLLASFQKLITHLLIMQKTSGTFWSYYKDISTDPIIDSHHLNTKAVLREKLLSIMFVQELLMYKVIKFLILTTM